MGCDSLRIVSTSQERKLRNRPRTFHPLNSKGAALNRTHFRDQSFSPFVLQTCGAVFIQRPEQRLQQKSAFSLFGEADMTQQRR